MCTLILLRRPDSPWPVLIAANRDEMIDRPARAPGRHWPDRPNVVAGYDELAHGSWMGVNDEGVIAAILNRKGTLGPLEGKRSRGELVLDALDYADAVDAADSLAHLSANAYRPFNMIIADNQDAFWLKNDGEKITRYPLGVGLFMIAAGEMNDEAEPRIQTFRKDFLQTASAPDHLDWTGWQDLLARPSLTGIDKDGMCFQLQNGFGTRCSSLAALTSKERLGEKPVWLFNDAPPDRPQWKPVAL